MSTRIEALRLIEIITDDLTGNSGIFSTTQQSKPTGSATDTHGPATTTGDTTSPHSGTDLCQFMQTSPSGNPGNRRASLGGDNLHNVYRSDSVVTRKVTGYPASHQSTSVPTSNWFAALSVLTQSPNGDELADTRHDSQSHTVDHQHSPIPQGKTPSPTTMHSGSSHSQSTNSELSQKFANLTIHTDNSNRRTVQFQENPTPKPVLPPAAAAMWRQSRSSLQTSVKASVRSEWLQNLCASEVTTLWAAGIAPLPPYCIEDQDLCRDIADIRKRAALDIQTKTAAHLQEKATREKKISTSLLVAAESISREDPLALENALNITSTMVGRTKAALIRDLRERKTYLSQRQLTIKDWVNIDRVSKLFTHQFQGKENSVEDHPAPTGRSSHTGIARKHALLPERQHHGDGSNNYSTGNSSSNSTARDRNQHFIQAASTGGNPRQRWRGPLQKGTTTPKVTFSEPTTK